MINALEVQKGKPGMKKNITEFENPRGRAVRKNKQRELTIGVDLGDKTSRYCVLDREGNVLFERSTATTKKGLAQAFASMGASRIAMEVGTHSPWVKRLLESWNHEVIVANAHRVKLITESTRKDDRLDARKLARLARVDPELLSPIPHRSEGAQAHLVMIRARAALVEARTLVNSARGVTKSFGERLASCDPDQMRVKCLVDLPSSLQSALQPLVTAVESLTRQIHEYDNKIAQIARSEYPETARLRQVTGVGELIALTYVLTLEDPQRFRRSRDVGGYLGLRPKRRDSGASRPQLRITKEGDVYLRTLLVQGAHYILGWHGVDTDLRRWGLKLAARGGKNAKKRAVIAVARKLAVLLHRLWVTGARYEPLRHSQIASSLQVAV
jgi:transposase